jgi:protein-S-isoprenylcysteine O-methyltransferase Ste14
MTIKSVPPWRIGLTVRDSVGWAKARSAVPTFCLMEIRVGFATLSPPYGLEPETPMPGYFGALAIVLLLGMVLSRVWLLKQQGVTAVKFGQIDKTDFLIPPVMLFYFYLVFAVAFGWTSVGVRRLFASGLIAWLGVAACAAGLLLLLWSLISFKQSFRIGIDTDRPDTLITSGAFAFSRNPIYVAFALVLIGEFLILPNWVFLAYIVGFSLLVHRQVLREEDYLKAHYGQQYLDYSNRVRRYL